MHTDWSAFLPELLLDCGAYQFHLDPILAIGNKYQDARYSMKPAPIASDIVQFNGRSNIVAPALCMRPDLDGTNMPSYQGHENLSVSKESFIIKKEPLRNYR